MLRLKNQTRYAPLLKTVVLQATAVPLLALPDSRLSTWPSLSKWNPSFSTLPLGEWKFLCDVSYTKHIAPMKNRSQWLPNMISMGSDSRLTWCSEECAALYRPSPKVGIMYFGIWSPSNSSNPIAAYQIRNSLVVDSWQNPALHSNWYTCIM